MTSYTTLEVENFKGIRKMKLEGLGMVNVFVGGNNVGKTSVLQALNIHFNNSQNRHNEVVENLKGHFYDGVLTHLIDELNPVNNFYKTLTDNVKIQIETDLDCSFISARFDSSSASPSIEIEPSIELSYSQKGVLCNTHRTPSIITILVDSLEEIKTRKVSNILEVYRNFNKQSHYIGSKADVTKFSEHLFQTYIENKQKNKVITLLQKSIQPNLIDIVYAPASKLLCELSDYPKMIPLDVMGDGFVKLLGLACLIGIPKNIFLVDELENGFHYSVQEDMWRMILTAAKEDGTQFFFTTHSYEVLESLNAMTQKITAEWEQEKAEGYQDGKLLVGENKTPMEPVCVFELEKSTDDVVTYKRFAGKSLNGAIKRHMELRGKGANAHG